MACYRNGGCGPYEMLSCNECPASKPEYAKRAGKICSLCDIKPFFNSDGEWEMFSSSRHLESGPWTTIYACKDKDGRLALFGAGDDNTDFYYPNFCPECGRELDK